MKEYNKKSGIYQILNLINNKIYVGSAQNLKQRWNRHKNDLRKGTHNNIHLIRAWNKYGEANFEFQVLEYILDTTLLLEKEQYYIDLLQPFYKKGYNIGLTSSGGDNLTMNPNRVDIINKITNSVKELWGNKTEEELIAYSEKYKGDGNPNWKGGISNKFCACGNEMGYSSVVCRECYDIKGEKNPFYGKHHTEENKKKSSERQKGIPKDGSNKPLIIYGVEYRSQTEAELALNIKGPTLRFRALSRNPKYKDYGYKGIEKIPYTEEEVFNKWSQAQKSVKFRNNATNPFFIDNIEYRTLKEATEVFNLTKSQIKHRIMSNKFPNFFYKNTQ